MRAAPGVPSGRDLSPGCPIPRAAPVPVPVVWNPSRGSDPSAPGHAPSFGQGHIPAVPNPPWASSVLGHGPSLGVGSSLGHQILLGTLCPLAGTFSWAGTITMVLIIEARSDGAWSTLGHGRSFKLVPAQAIPWFCGAPAPSWARPILWESPPERGPALTPKPWDVPWLRGRAATPAGPHREIEFLKKETAQRRVLEESELAHKEEMEKLQE